MIKTIRVMLVPNNKQKTKLFRYASTFRFAYNWTLGREKIDNTEKPEQEELVEDLVEIITVFSCKLQGKRANKARKLVEELTDEGGEKDDKDNSSNVSPK